MSEIPSQPFSNPELKDILANTTSATLVVQLSKETILQQADIATLDVFPDLPNYQKAARKNAELWNINVLPATAKATANIIDYAHVFKSFHEILVKCARDFTNCDSKKMLVEGLRMLYGEVRKKSDATKAIIEQLVIFHAALAEDNKKFEGVYNKALVKIEGDDGEIKALGQQLDVIQSAMERDIFVMAGEAVAVTIGGGQVTVAIGSTLTIRVAGASTALTGGGFLVMLDGAIVTISGAVDYYRKMKEQKKIAEKLAVDKQEMVALKHVKVSLERFLAAINHTISSAQCLVDAWMGLGADLQIVIEALDRVSPSISSDFIVAQLNAADKDWEVALEKAKQLQPGGQVLVKFYEDLQDAFKETNPQG